MKKLITATVLGLSLSSILFTSQIQANSALNTVNTAVEQRAIYLDENFGVLLTTQERQNLKLALIAKQVVTNQAIAAGKTSHDLATEASEIYQIEDESAQRQLLVEIDAAIVYVEGGGGGIKPKCC